MGRLKEILKKAGKGLVVTAASVIAGATLGPLAAGAVGSFLSKAMGDIGVKVSQEIIDEAIEGKIMDAPHKLMELGRPQDIEEVSGDIAAKTGLPQEEIKAALQYSLRELQNSLGDLTMELRGNTMLLGEVFKLANESDAKIDVVLAQSQETQDAIGEVLRRLDAMERGLDISYRKFIGSYSDPKKLTVDRLRVISKLQRQRTIVASGFGVRYDSNLYVPRQEEESVFNRFMGDTGMSDRNIFLVLGNAGLGKTWFMAKMSDLSLEIGSPTFFVPLSHGIKALTSVFQVETIPALVDLIDPLLDQAGEHAFIFLDGLDEMDPRNIRHVLGSLASARSNSVSFVLSCRAADWATNRSIVQGANDLKYYIYENKDAEANARALRINTAVSVLMSEFTDSELRAAMKRYGLPEEVPFDLLPLLHRPYILRLSTEWYNQVGSLPSPSSPEFLDLFAGGPEYADSVFRRLGILTERDSLYATVEKLIEAQRDSLPLGQLPLDPESTTFNTLVSSGILQITLGRIGTTISLTPEFTVPLFSLTILRHQTDPPKLKKLLDVVKGYMPEQAPVIQRIVEEIVTPSGTRIERVEPVIPEPVVDVPHTPTPTRTDPPIKKGLLQPGDKGATLLSGRGASVAVPPKEEPEHVREKSGKYPDDVKHLIFLFNDREIQVKRAAMMALGMAASRLSESDARVELIEGFLEDGDTDVRVGATLGMSMVAATLKNAGERIDLLKPLIEDWEWSVRRTAAFGLTLMATKLSDEAKRDEIIKPLLEARDGQVRSGAAEGLGFGAMSYLTPMDAHPVIQPLLKDNFEGVRKAAALGLGLLTSTQADCDATVELLTPITKLKTGKERIGAIMGLCLIGSRLPDCSGIVRTVTPLLEDMDYEVRSASAIGLGLAASGLPDPSSMSDLLNPLLSDDEPEVQYSAALGLGLIASKLPNPSIFLKSLIEHDIEHVRSGGAIALGIVGTRFSDPSDMIDLLKPLAEDTERSVRKGAVIGLSLAATKLRDKEKRIELITPFASDEDDEIRKASALGLGIINTEPELGIGTVLGEVFWGTAPLNHDECIATGIAASLLLRYGQ